MDRNIILSVHDLDVKFTLRGQTLHAIRGISLDLYQGESLAIVGESGSGKSVFTKTFMGLLDANGYIDGGSILYNGQDLTKFTTEKEWLSIRGREIAMVMQDPMTSLNPLQTIGRQIEEAVVLHQGLKGEAAKKAVLEILADVGIDEPAKRYKQYPHEFSGGMRQRVVIAIAVACRPKILICDEPTTALDVTIQAQVLEMMKGLRDKYNTSMLMITHDLGIVAEICDEVSVVYAGRVIEHGTLEDIFKNTRHPYTEGLFNSLPNLENRQAELKPIKGLMPDPSNLPKGCAFCPRCEYAMEICKTQKPPRTYRNDTHYVECHLYNKDNIHEGKVNIR